MKFLSASALLLVATAWPERAASDRALTFERDVRPVLKAHCFHCHGEGEKLKGDVDLRLRRFMADKQTDEGRVLTPGKPQASLMVKPMRAGEMPKGEKKVPEKDIALIEKWIMAGDRLVVHDGRIMSKKADASSESFRV